MNCKERWTDPRNGRVYDALVRDSSENEDEAVFDCEKEENLIIQAQGEENE